MDSVALMTNILVQILTKVDNCVLQITIASLGLTFAACLVLLGLRCSANLEVTREPAAALHALLKVCVAVEFGNFVWVNTTFEMEAINVLADNTLQDSSVLKLDESHVCSRRSSLLNGLSEGYSVC